MTQTVAVVDYGAGNLYSVQKALERCGTVKVCVTADAQQIASADRLILPGVGAFASGMRELNARSLVATLQQFAKTGRPILGICLGMQMLASSGHEFGVHAGLGLIDGQVVEIPRLNPGGVPRKVPYIGWASTAVNAKLQPASILRDLSPGNWIYLVHSFHFEAQDSQHVLASYRHDGFEVTAAVQKSNVIGVQFHPEKSGEVGLNILSNFLRL